jgi:hypothetical protein
MADNKLCFVIGPIGDDSSDARIHADWLLEGIIEPVLAEFPGFTVRRADHDSRPGLIDAQMINDLLTADLVIADLSFSNPNAFYEIGIRHMAQKPIIHMQLATEKPPFDVSLYRAIKFSRLKYRDLSVAKEELKRAVEAVFATDYQVENPVTNARGRLRLEEHATPEIQVLLDQIRGMQGRLDRLEYSTVSSSTNFWINKNRLPHRDIKATNVFYGGGEGVPTATTMLTFISGTSFTDAEIGIIHAVLVDRYGAVTQLARTSSELTVAVPGDININDINLPRELAHIEIVPMRPFKDQEH